MVDQNTRHSLALLATPQWRTLRMLAAVATAAILTLIVFAGAASAHGRRCAYAHTPISAASRPDLRRAVLCLVNKERTARHLPGLAGNGRLDRSAQGWTNEMVTHHAFSHGADFASRISAVGFDWSNVGENIAAGFDTPASVVRAWMQSTGHCQNILSPVYRMVGTGVSGGAPDGSDHGTWTQDFGLWMGQPAGSGNYGPAEGCPYSG